MGFFRLGLKNMIELDQKIAEQLSEVGLNSSIQVRCGTSNSFTVTADQGAADGILVDSYEPRIVLKNRRSSGNDSVAIRYDNATPSLQIRTSRDSYAVPMAMFNDDGATFGINAGAWGAGVAIASGASYSLDNTTSNRITRVSGKIDYLSTDTHVFNNPITVTGSVRPGTDNGFDLGTAALRWSKAYLDDGFIEINADGATTDHAGAGRFWVSGTTPYFNDSVIQLGTGDPVTAASGRWTDGNSTLAPILMADYGAVANAASRAGTAAYLYWNNTTSTLHVRNINVGSVAALPADTTATTQSSGDNSTKVATTAYADAAGGGISWDGSTANGIATYKDADEATVESNFTFDGTTATISSATSINASSKGTLTDENLLMPSFSPSALLNASPRLMPTSSTVWWASTSISPFASKSISNPPCLDS